MNQALLVLESDPNQKRLREIIQHLLDILGHKMKLETWPEFQRLFAQLIPYYVQFTQACRPLGVPTQTLRYSNGTRSVFHGCTALVVITVYELLLKPFSMAISVSWTAAALCWFGEALKYHNERFMTWMIKVLGP